MTPQQFKQKWGPGGPAFHLNEEQGAQSHFLDLCELLGVPKAGKYRSLRFGNCSDSLAPGNLPVLVDRINFESVKITTTGAE
jgi:hypothetical protein